jgi:hypothetical protein
MSGSGQLPRAGDEPQSSSQDAAVQEGGNEGSPAAEGASRTSSVRGHSPAGRDGSGPPTPQRQQHTHGGREVVSETSRGDTARAAPATEQPTAAESAGADTAAVAAAQGPAAPSLAAGTGTTTTLTAVRSRCTNACARHFSNCVLYSYARYIRVLQSQTYSYIQCKVLEGGRRYHPTV